MKYSANLWLEIGIFPFDLKFAKVTPIYKAGDNNDLTNYSPPTSVLRAIQKFLTK